MTFKRRQHDLMWHAINQGNMPGLLFGRKQDAARSLLLFTVAVVQNQILVAGPLQAFSPQPLGLPKFAATCPGCEL